MQNHCRDPGRRNWPWPTFDRAGAATLPILVNNRRNDLRNRSLAPRVETDSL